MRGWTTLIGMLAFAVLAGAARADDESVAAAPTSGASALLAAARETMSRDLGKAVGLADEARRAAVREGRKPLQIEAESLLAQIELQRSNTAGATPHIAAVEALLADPAMKTFEAELWWLRGRLAVQERRGEEADQALRRAFDLAAASGDRQTQARSLHTRAQLLIRGGKQAEAEPLLEQSLALNMEDGREHEADANRHYLGFIARDRGAYEHAVDLHLTVLQHADRRHDTQGIAHSANALGIVYSLRHQVAESETYFRRAFEAYRDLGDSYSAAMALINIADNHLSTGAWSAARGPLYEAKVVVEGIDNEDARILLFSELARCHVGLGELAVAEDFAQRAVDLSNGGAPVRRQQALYALAKLRMAQHRSTDAVALWADALTLARQNRRQADIAEILRLLAEAEAAVGRAADAYDHEHEAADLLEEMQKQELSQRVLETAARYEAGKREAELAAKQARIADLEEAARQHQRIRLLLVMALALAVLLALSLQSRARAKASVERVLREKNLIAEQANRDLAEAADADPLTGARNRRYFRRELADRLQQRLRVPGDLALVLIDADHFKQVNDRYGHAVGDAALQAIVAAWRNLTGSDERVIRWGGEEFLVLFEGVDAEQVSDQVARGLAAVRAASQRDPALPAGLSVSCGWFVGPCAGIRLDDALRLADLALLEAKRRGRDRAIGVLGALLAGGDPATMTSFDDLPAGALLTE